MESWCLLLAGDGLLIGAELDRNLFGWEAEPVDVLLDAPDELKRIGKDISAAIFLTTSSPFWSAESAADFRRR